MSKATSNLAAIAGVMFSPFKKRLRLEVCISILEASSFCDMPLALSSSFIISVGRATANGVFLSSLLVAIVLINFYQIYSDSVFKFFED